MGLAHLLYVRCVDGLEATTSATQPFPRTPRQSHNGPQKGSPSIRNRCPTKHLLLQGTSVLGLLGQTDRLTRHVGPQDKSRDPKGQHHCWSLGSAILNVHKFFLYVFVSVFCLSKVPLPPFQAKEARKLWGNEISGKNEKRQEKLPSFSILTVKFSRKGQEGFFCYSELASIEDSLVILMSWFLMIFSRVWWVF